MKNSICFIAAICASACFLTACHDDDDDGGMKTCRHNVTFISSKNGPGDNGYNDMIVKSEVFFAMCHHDVKTSFVIPSSKDYSAEQVYNIYTRVPDSGDSVLIVLNGSDYTELSRSNKSLSTENDLVEKAALDLRVLAFEDDGHDLPQRVHSFKIQRYGAFYVAGRLLGKKPAVVVAGMKGDPQIEDAVQGFIDGYSLENPDGPIVCYLANDYSGFDNADKAVQVCDSVLNTFPKEQLAHKDDSYTNGVCFVPVAGGSNVGMYAFVHNLRDIWDVDIIGVDEDYNNNSTTIPFSLVLPLWEILNEYLEDWYFNIEWPKWQSFGLDSEFHIQINISPYVVPNFLLRYVPDGRLDNPATDERIQNKVKELIQEATEKEKAYEEKLKGGKG